MSNFIIVYDGKIKIFERKYINDRYEIRELSDIESELLLLDFTNGNIDGLNIRNDETIELIKKDKNLILRGANVFNSRNDKLAKYIESLGNVIDRYMEEKTRLEQKEILKQAGGKVSRKRKVGNSLKKKIVAIGLLGTISITSLVSLKSCKLSKQNEPITELDYSSSISVIPSEPELPIIEEENIQIALDFDDWTGNGRLDNTILYYGDIIKYYSERYGLSYELLCAQITQERPNIINGECKNIFQITPEYFVGEKMKVPVYDENGLTGEYDEFVVTEAMLNTPEGNIKTGVAYKRNNTDLYKSIFAGGLLSYNQGPTSLINACNYYGLDINDYKGDVNAIITRDLINKYYKEQSERENKNDNHGDKQYYENVFRYLPLDNGATTISYYIGDKLHTADIINTRVVDKIETNDYNSGLARG